ncbi:MAG: ABC transporter substrate-binding protein, partial [Promethearchaeota archaeon]
EFNMEMEKKNLAIIILAVVLAASGVGNIILAAELGLIEVTPPKMEQSIVMGTIAGPTDMDPELCYDTAGGQVINQICEGFYKFDVTDPAYPLIPILATTLPVVGGTAEKPTLTFTLRQGVNFQDGTPFNADAAAWKFNRLMHFMNYSGNQYLPAPFNVPVPPTLIISKLYALFMLDYDGNGIDEPVINHTEVLSTYSLRLHLNYPKASFISLLNFHATYFHSPTSAQAQGKELEYLTYADEDVLIGTGPFKFQNYFTDIQVKFTKNYNYWRTPSPKLDNITFWIIEDDIALCTAVLAGDIDIFLAPRPEFFDQFRADPDITLLEAGPTLNNLYMGFNGVMVNTTFRKAISYAVNYSYIINQIYTGIGLPTGGPIPTGIPMSNHSFNKAVFDRAYAQSVMQSMGFGVGFTTNQQWLDVADAGGWAGTEDWNITAQTEGTLRRDAALYMSDNLRYIGIDAPVVQIPFGSIIACMVSAKRQIPMYILGWAPDYIDPENYITPLYSNTSALWVETYDYDLEVLMRAGETTVDLVARQAIYNEIQRSLVEELYFFVWILVGINYDVYQDYVKDWVPNAIARTEFYEPEIGLNVYLK